MTPKARLDALHRLLTALVASPSPTTLVLACTDHELVYLLHALHRLDEESPCDRLLIAPHPFLKSTTYIDALESTALPSCPPVPQDSSNARPAPRDSTPPSSRPLPRSSPTSVPTSTPLARLQALFTRLLADLPPGDHHLLVALIPAEIHDPPAFAALAEALLAAPIDPRLRLLLRDDRLAPRHFELASTCPFEHVLAYSFELPLALVLASITAAAHDPHRRPDERAQALLQLACQDLARGRPDDALARCHALARLPASPQLLTFALALEADVHRHRGDTDAALALGAAALERAVELSALPVVLHAALALGELTRDLGRPAEAAACFDLAERAAPFDPEARAHCRALRSALPEARC